MAHVAGIPFAPMNYKKKYSKSRSTISWVDADCIYVRLGAQPNENIVRF